MVIFSPREKKTGVRCGFILYFFVEKNGLDVVIKKVVLDVVLNFVRCGTF